VAKVELKYVIADKDRHGNIRYYFRRRGRGKIRLRGEPGTNEFLAAYSAATSAPNSATVANSSLDWLINQYFKSADFMLLGQSTRERRRRILHGICD
jgi:hypothetical protein